MKKAHLIGICGKGMAGLAVLLKETGWEVTGSDQGFYDPVYSYLTSKGIIFAPTYSAENIPADATLIVIGRHAKLVPEENAEVKAAFESGIKVVSFPEVIHTLTKDTDNIVIAGSFGKSTCTALVAWCLLAAERDPSYLIGAVPFGFESAAHHGADREFVLEGDEYPSANWDTTSKFLYYNAHTLLLTSGEHDHLNVFPTLEDYLLPFEKLISQIEPTGLIVVSKNGAHMHKLLTFARGIVVTYGLDSSADWYADDIEYGDTTTFSLCHNGENIATLETTMLGAHNIENIVGCAALLLEKKLVTTEQLQKGIQSFLGLSGRIDRKEANSTVAIYEGFGSSQAKLASTFEAIKLHFPTKKILAVFEPHTFSWRNRAALPWYENAFADADTVLVFEPPLHGANTQDQLTLDEIVNKISQHHTSVFPIRTKEEGLEKISSLLKPDDIILLITSGDLGGLIPEVPKLAEKLFPRIV